MGLSVTVKIIGAQEEIARLQALGSSFTDFSAAMKIIGKDLKNYYKDDVFASEGGLLGSPWQGLSKRYALRKAKTYPGKSILVATGNLKKSFSYSTTKNSVLITNKAPYFKYHQSTLPRKKMPFRPMLGVNSEVEGIVHKIIDADVKRKIAALT